MAFYNANMKKTEKIPIGLVLGTGTTFDIKNIIQTKRLEKRIDYTKLRSGNFHVIANAMTCNITIQQQGYANAAFTPADIMYDERNGTLTIRQAPTLRLDSSSGNDQRVDSNNLVILTYSE